MRKTIVVAFCVGLVSVVGSKTASATPINFLTVASGAYLLDSATSDVKETMSSPGPELTRTATEAYSYFGPPGVVGSYTASGDAKYGALKASISANASANGVQPRFILFSFADYADAYTFGTPGGRSGTAYLTFTIDGSGFGPPGNQIVIGGVHATTYGSFQSGLFGSAETGHFLDATDVSATATFTSDPIPFIAGVPVNVEAILGAELELYCVDAFPVGFGCGSWSGGAFSDFSHTATLTGITLVDSSGNPITDFTVSAASGTPLDANGVVAAPEPMTLCLLGTGLLWIRRMRRRSTT
jgi:hypothetical protein